jgi:hypothetical protein
MKNIISFIFGTIIVASIQPCYSKLTDAQKFSGVAHIVPYGDITLKGKGNSIFKIKGKYEFDDALLSDLFRSKILPKRIGKNGLVVKLKTKKDVWENYLKKIRNLDKPLRLKFSDGSSLSPYFIVDKYPVSITKKANLYHKGDGGIFRISNNSNIAVDIGVFNSYALPKEITVDRDKCSHKRIRPGKFCDLFLSLRDDIKYYRNFDIVFTPKTAKVSGSKAKAAASSSPQQYLFPSLPVGAPSGEYISSCSNISYIGSTISADCTFWNGYAFANATGQTIDANQCSNGIRSDPFSGRLFCNSPAPQPNSSWIPSGTYKNTCSNIQLESDNVLTAECSNGVGTFVTSTLDYSNCLGAPVANNGGKLVCPEMGSSIEKDNPFTFSPPSVSNPSNLKVQNVGTFQPWQNVASIILPSDPSNPAFTTGANSKFEISCAGLNAGYSVNFFQSDNTKAILYGYGPFKGDKRNLCNVATDVGQIDTYFTGTLNTIYYNHGNTLRGCDISAFGQFGLSYGNGFANNEAFWANGSPELPSGLMPCNIPQKETTQSQSPQVILPMEQWQTTTVGGDFPSLGGMQLITPGQQYYPAYGIFFKNSTNDPITLQANSITTSYCQNQPKWETGLNIFGEALASMLGAYSPTSASSILDNLSGEVSAEDVVFSAITNPPSCSGGQASVSIKYPTQQTIIQPSKIEYLGGAVLDNFDYFLSTTINVKNSISVNHSAPITFNDGWHALFVSFENNCTLKISTLSDLKNFSPTNSVTANISNCNEN